MMTGAVLLWRLFGFFNEGSLFCYAERCLMRNTPFFDARLPPKPDEPKTERKRLYV